MEHMYIVNVENMNQGYGISPALGSLISTASAGNYDTVGAALGHQENLFLYN